MWIKCIKKTIDSFKNDGFKCTVKKIWHWLSLRVYRKAIMYEKQLIVSNLDLTDNLDIRIALKEDIIDEEYKDIWYTKKQAIEKLSKGHILFLAKNGNTNIFYGWVELLDIKIPWLWIKKLCIPPDIGYMSRFYVLLQFRDQSISKQVLRFIEKYLLDNTPVNKIFCVTAPDNLASNKLFATGSYTSYQHIVYFNLIGFKLYVVRSLEDKKRRIKKYFIQNSNFWNIFSSMMKKVKDV